MKLPHNKHNLLTPPTKIENEIVIALAGNPNVGKSTVFNQLTGMNQHTGNWAGKTISLATGEFNSGDYTIKLVDLPGSYSLQTDTPEEKVTNDYITEGAFECLIIVADATSLERNLNLVLQILTITHKAVLCLNFMDEMKKKGISVDTDELSLQLGIPVVAVSARNKQGIKSLIDTATGVANGSIKTYQVRNITSTVENISDYSDLSERISALSKKITDLCLTSRGEGYSESDRKMDNLLLSPATGIPMMLLVFGFIFWLTAVGANYPGQLLSFLFEIIRNYLNKFLVLIGTNEVLRSILIDGVYTTVSWVVSVMLPPALIFFPLFAILEDTGILPRFAFNLDRIFSKAGTNGKQALTMLMGFGCNACGVMGCRIIRSKRERLCAIITNSFIPCNGRLPTIIMLVSVFFCNSSNGFLSSLKTALILLLILVFAVFVTLVVSYIMSRFIKDKSAGGFILELPPYRKPQFIRVILLSIKDKVLYVLSRAVIVAIPAGILIWLLSNIYIDSTPLVGYVSEFLNPVGEFIGVDGVILTATLLSFPANEIFIPIMLMIYSSGSVLAECASSAQLGTILANNGWSVVTALCAIILCVFHFPCSTTCLSIKRETGSVFWTIVSVMVPLATGMFLCLCINILLGCFAT
ncbi:MAG: ferrous iron transporter B [Ruminococcus sp.]|nr:ferrous iron transporter B [Ruminococcus sp.]